MARGGVGWRLLNVVVVGQTPPLILAPPFSPGSSSAGSSALPGSPSAEIMCATLSTLRTGCMAQSGRAAGGIAAAKLALSGANPTLGASGENGSWEDGLGPLQMLPRRLSRAPRACVVRRLGGR